MGRRIPKLAAAVAVAAAIAPGTGTAKGWEAGSSIDKMSGAKSTMITTYAVLPPSFKGRQLRSRLFIQCEPKKAPALIAELGFPIARTSKGEARIKFDDAAPKTVTGSISTDREALFLPGPASLIQQLSKAKEFRVEVTAVTQQPIILAFAVGGLSEQTAALTACGIKLK